METPRMSLVTPRVTGHAPWLRLVRTPRPEYNAPPVLAPVRTPKEAAALFSDLENEDSEVFCVAILNAQHRCIARVEVTRGLLDSSLVHPREVFRMAIALNASALIVAHNHPSGDPTPSVEDRNITAQLVAAGKLLDIAVHDHLIIGAARYISFAEQGWL